MPPRSIVVASLLAALAVLGTGGVVRYLHTMPVGTGETRASPDGRFRAAAFDYFERSFVTGEGHRWFEFSVEGPGVSYHFIGSPLPGPYFGSRSSQSVVRWQPDSSAVRFVFPTVTLEVSTRPASEE